MNYLRQTFVESFLYIQNAFEAVKPIWAVFITIGSYVLFPDQAMIAPAYSLLGMIVLDIMTKYYSIARKHRVGWIRAFKDGKWNSSTFWEGSYKKIVGVMVLFILCGLTVRFFPFISTVGVAFATFAYAVMFIREAQSVAENMIEAGHENYEVYLKWFKRKEKEVLGDSEQKEDAHEDNR